MAHLLSALAIIVNAAGLLNAAPTLETINIALDSLENFDGAHSVSNLVVGLDCVKVQEVSLPTRLKLNTADTDSYSIVTHESPDCNDKNPDKLSGTANMILNDRHPICSFKLNLEEDNPTSIGKVKVAFHLRNEMYSKEFNDTNGKNPQDICSNGHSAWYSFAEKITVYSENPDINDITVFRGFHPAHDANYLPITVRNETNIVQETLKHNKKIVHSIKIIQNSPSNAS